MSKYPKTLGRIEAVWNKLGGEDGVDRFLRDELSVSEPIRSWRKEDGLTVGKLLFTTQTGIAVYDCGDYFRFTLPATDGTTGEDWIKRLGGNDFRVGDYAKQVLRS